MFYRDLLRRYMGDLASYPADFSGSMSFHEDFIDLVNQFAQRETWDKFNSVARVSGDALELYNRLRFMFVFP
jgi:hypothetical protein